jgi:polysaccharide chain length determinant protein (PEP-CTERM system associated)
VEELPNTMNIKDYLAVAFRRKWLIVISLLISIIVSFGIYKYLPKEYKANTVILVQPQRVPEDYVRSTVTASVSDRLNTISQEILSRTRLEKTIQEFDLRGDVNNSEPMEVTVEKLKTAIEVKVQGGGTQNTISISFRGNDPKTVMMVTSRLASWFIEENLKIRELQAEGTAEFISKELSAVEEKLLESERKIRNFRERNMGALPQQLDANLKILDGLQQELKRVSDSIRTIEDRRIVLNNQIEQIKREKAPTIREGQNTLSSASENKVIEQIPEDPAISQFNTLKKELDNARAKYTENHPDIVDLKRKIASLEPQVNKAMKELDVLKEFRLADEKSRRRQAAERSVPIQEADPMAEKQLNQYAEQYSSLLIEGKRLREEEKRLKDQIYQYQRRIEDTPRREQEVISLSRDYELLKALYQSLMDKKMASQMAQNLERKQQGEQFRILDPARLPQKPFKPDFNKIMLVGAFIGLCCGGGLAWFSETWNQKFHTEAEVENALGIPVIAVIPSLREETTKKKAA